MNLKLEEYEIIRHRMLKFKIPYQEVYDELLDHIVTDIETKRTAGDLREVSEIMDDLINNSLGGAVGIKKMAREQENLYRLKIHRRIWKIYSRQLWWKTLAAVAGCVVLDRFIPNTTNYTIGIYGLVLLTMVMLEANVLINMRSVKLTDNKQSLLKTNIVWHVFMPMTLLNMAFLIPNLISSFSHYHARAFIKVHPIIPLIIFCYTLMYVESCYRVMKEEMQAAKAN